MSSGQRFALFAAAASRASRALDHAMSRMTAGPLPKPAAADPFAGLLPFELTSREALVTPSTADGGVNVAYSSMLLDFAGVCALRKAVTPELASTCGRAAEGLTDDVRELVKKRGIDPDAPDGFQFRGAHQRDPGRIDVRNHHTMDKSPFDHPSLNDDAAWMPVVRNVLGDDAQLIFKGLVVTEPGTDEQVVTGVLACTS